MKKSTSRECVYIKRKETEPIEKQNKGRKNIPRRLSKMYTYEVMMKTFE